ncbi:carboxypeptidase N subunit 2-like isoform X2 [Zootermopsis nevadensis]|nr:carboxypeptidase N subunit 2-like isoform X2 [Zootermopsis nevadensis]
MAKLIQISTMSNKQTSVPRWSLVLLLCCSIGVCSGCPEPCECYKAWDRSIIANCTRKDLALLPEFEEDVAQLDISYNDLGTLQHLWNSSGYLSLKELRADAARIQYIYPGAFSHMAQLLKLFLRYNFIENLELGVFEGLESLEELRLEGNRLQGVRAQVFQNMTQMVELYLHNNQIEIISPGAFDGLNCLKILSLSNNFLARLASQTFYGLTRLVDLRLHRNYMKFLDLMLFRTLTNLRYLRFNDNEIEEVVLGTFSGLQSLVSLNMNGNCLRQLQYNHFSNVTGKQSQALGIFAGLSNLVYLHVSDNLLEELGSVVFKDLVSLKFLDVSRNRLITLNEHTFLHNTLLTDLRLSNNPRLTAPRNASFINVKSLQSLHLSNCRITDLTERSFKYLPNLQDIRLDRNSLKTLKVDTLTGLMHLSQISLYGNPLVCDCELKKTWQWCHSNNVHLTHKNSFCIQNRNMVRMSWDLLESFTCSDYSSGRMFFESFHSFVEPVVYAIILLSGATGTGALLLIFTTYERILKIPNACIFSIAVGDFIMIMVFLPMSFVNAFTEVWKFGLPLCKIFIFSRDLTVGVTVFSVMLFAHHTYTWTVLSCRLRNCGFGSSSKAGVFNVFGILFVAAALAFPAFLWASNDSGKCSYAPNNDGVNFIPYVTLIQLFIYSIMPLCFIVLIYTVTERYIVFKSPKLAGKLDEKKMCIRKELSKVAVILSIVLFVSYAPNIIMRVLIGFSIVNQNLDITKVFVFLTDCLFYSNTWLNPLALYCTCSTYKSNFKRIVYCERFRKQRPKPRDSTSHAAASEGPSSVAEIRY